jgi:hypothetical protein
LWERSSLWLFYGVEATVMDGWMDGTIKGHRDDEKES